MNPRRRRVESRTYVGAQVTAKLFKPHRLFEDTNGLKVVRLLGDDRIEGAELIHLRKTGTGVTHGEALAQYPVVPVELGVLGVQLLAQAEVLVEKVDADVLHLVFLRQVTADVVDEVVAAVP